MRVARATGFGGPEVLVTADVPEPVAGPGQVVVEVAAADTIFLDTQLRSGWGGEYFTLEPPYVPGGGVAGTVRAVGAGADAAAWLGRRVAASIGFTGGYAERAVTGVESLAAVPDGLALTDAAALVHDGVTATALLDLTEPKPGETVLVVGASGGMGTLLVQLAKAAGARVVGTARGGRKTALVRELGADAVIDAGAPDWVARAREALGPAGAESCWTAWAARWARRRSRWWRTVAGSPRTGRRPAVSPRSTRPRRGGGGCGCWASGTSGCRCGSTWRSWSGCSPRRRAGGCGR